MWPFYRGLSEIVALLFCPCEGKGVKNLHVITLWRYLHLPVFSIFHDFQHLTGWHQNLQSVMSGKVGEPFGAVASSGGPEGRSCEFSINQ